MIVLLAVDTLFRYVLLLILLVSKTDLEVDIHYWYALILLCLKIEAGCCILMMGIVGRSWTLYDHWVVLQDHFVWLLFARKVFLSRIMVLGTIQHRQVSALHDLILTRRAHV